EKLSLEAGEELTQFDKKSGDNKKL
ncbi:MAG: hypothetical protein K0S18_842, partial [Anaerocolumna sp.]|nr:hypothetical protein [Anaerocolumna sp.]